MEDGIFRQKHHLKLFEVDGRRYVAGLLTGQVIPIQPERRHRSFEIEQILLAIHPESEQKLTERR